MCNSAYEAALTAAADAMDLAPCDGCDLCGIRCAAGVPMSRAEFAAVRECAARPAVAARLAMLARQDREMPLGDGFTALACRFRDTHTGGCAVYPVRPLACRLLGHVEWMPCPVGRITRHVPTGRALELMRRYAALERHTYEEWLALPGGEP